MIQTVLGPIEPALLGVTSMHEHVLADASSFARPGTSRAPDAREVDVTALGYLRWNQLGLADNLRLTDRDVQAHELARAVACGQKAVVEATSLGLGPDHAGLPEISRRSGSTIVASYGAYLEQGLPSWFADLSEAQREEHFVAALDDHLPAVGFRAGMLGIMGTSAEPTPSERSSLAVAARAAARTGASVSIRLDPDGRAGLDVIELCAAAGLAYDRIVLTNVDEYLDKPYLTDLAQTGVVLEMCFGNEAFHFGRVRNVSDLQRLDFFLDFLASVPSARWVLGTSLWTKAQLARFGGPGYDHLQARVVPALLASGVTSEKLDELLVATPMRLLNR